jgi:hypothetical protein
MIHQHQAPGADRAITDAIDTHVQTERDGDDDADSPSGVHGPAG